MLKTLLKPQQCVLKKLVRYYTSQATPSLSVFNVLNDKKEGEFVKVQGWIKSVRKMKENVFVDVGDGSCANRLQIILENTQKNHELTVESSIEVTGVLGLSPRGHLELKGENVEVKGQCDVAKGYPFLPRKKYTQEYVRGWPHFRNRTNVFQSILRIRNEASLAIHDYFNKNEYILINTPILTSNDCEGAGEVFRVVPESKKMLLSMKKEDVDLDEAFFDKKVFLTVSGQLHLEAMAHGLTKVYTFGPTFRAENSKSRLHLSEFYMLEVETAFLNNLNELLKNVEDLFKNLTLTLLKKCQEDLSKCLTDTKKLEDHFGWLNKPFPICKFDEAIDILLKNNIKYNESIGLTKEHELFLVEHFGNIPMFLINFPTKQKPFYMKQSTDDPLKVDAFDLIVPNVGEVVGGSLREDSYENLFEKLPGDGLNWYLELRQFGGVSTGGFGLGFERYLQFLCNVNSIKDVIPFPRWPHSCSL